MREESDEGWTNSVGKRMVHAASDGEVGGCAGDSRVEKKIYPEFRRCVMYDNGSICNLDLKIMV